MTQSILDSTKKVLGLPADYTPFDVDIVMHINSVFFTLHQLGVGPDEGFTIENSDAVWEDFMLGEKVQAVKSYMYLRVRLLFDPPSTSFAIESLKRQAEEFEWRLNVHMEGVRHPLEQVSGPE